MFKKHNSKNTPFAALAVLAAAVWLGTAHAALAQVTNLGELFCQVVVNGRPFGTVFSWIAYLAGIVSAIQGIHYLRLHTDDPRNHKLQTPLMFLFGAMCLLALPGFVGTIVSTLYGLGGGTGSAGGALACAAGAVTGGPGLDGMMAGFISNIKAPMETGISLVAVLCGLFMMVRGLMKASKHGIDPKTHSMHSILTNIGFGALLFTIGDNLSRILASVFGTNAISTNSVISWAGLSTLTGGAISTQFQTAVVAGLTFVQLIGCIAFVRGWLILKKVVEGASNVTLAQGLTHILGGVLAINIFQFLVLMDTTFGTNLLN